MDEPGHVHVHHAHVHNPHVHHVQAPLLYLVAELLFQHSFLYQPLSVQAAPLWHHRHLLEEDSEELGRVLLEDLQLEWEDQRPCLGSWPKIET